MIAFLVRLTILLVLFVSFTFNILVFLYGVPHEETWRFLIDHREFDMPVAAIIVTVAASFSFFIAIWMTIAVKLKENQTTRLVKKVAQPDFPQK